MPSGNSGNATVYAERLRVPWQWWLISAVGLFVGGLEIFAGLAWHIGLIVYAVLGVPLVVLLVGMGRGRVVVDADGLRAGGRLLPRAQLGSAKALDRVQTRQRLGPAADPNAVVFARGFVRTAVLVRPRGDGPPYWLVSTRRPQQLLAALHELGAAVE
jgi:hypothetical protein